MLLIDHLKQLRNRVEAIGVSLIVKQSGLSYNTVNNFLAGRNPTEKTMVAVENACAELERVR